MAVRRITTLTSSTAPREVRVLYDSDLQEYCAKIYRGGKHYEPADCFDDDKESILSTAAAMLREEEQAYLKS